MKFLLPVGLCCLIAVAYAIPSSIAAKDESEDQIDEAIAQLLDHMNEAKEQYDHDKHLNDLADIEDNMGNEQNDIANSENTQDIEELADIEGSDTANVAGRSYVGCLRRAGCTHRVRRCKRIGWRLVCRYTTKCKKECRVYG